MGGLFSWMVPLVIFHGWAGLQAVLPGQVVPLVGLHSGWASGLAPPLQGISSCASQLEGASACVSWSGAAAGSVPQLVGTAGWAPLIGQATGYAAHLG